MNALGIYCDSSSSLEVFGSLSCTRGWLGLCPCHNIKDILNYVAIQEGWGWGNATIHGTSEQQNTP